MTTLAEQLERLAAEADRFRTKPGTPAQGRTLADIVADLIAALKAGEAEQ